MAELRGRKKNNRLGLVHRTSFALKVSEPQISGRMDGSQGQMAETENQFTDSERQAKASLQLFPKGEKKLSVWMCEHRRGGKNLPEENNPSQRGEIRVFQQEKVSLLFQKSLVWGLFFLDLSIPKSLVSEESSGCFRHWVIRYTQGNKPTAIKPQPQHSNLERSLFVQDVSPLLQKYIS